MKAETISQCQSENLSSQCNYHLELMVNQDQSRVCLLHWTILLVIKHFFDWTTVAISSTCLSCMNAIATVLDHWSHARGQDLCKIPFCTMCLSLLHISIWFCSLTFTHGIGGQWSSTARAWHPSLISKLCNCLMSWSTSPFLKVLN